MISLDRAQRARLGIFLIGAAVIAAAAFAALFGPGFFEEYDEYVVRFESSVSGLSKGASVTYHGVRIGEVVEVGIDRGPGARAWARIQVEDGTHIPQGSTASMALEGITGKRAIEISSASIEVADSEKPPIPVGGEIPSKKGLVDVLGEKATEIADKMNTLLGNMVAMTDGKSDMGGKMSTIAEEVHGLVRDVRGVLAENRGPIRDTIADLEQAIDEIEPLLADSRLAIATLGNSVDPQEVSATLRTLRGFLGYASRAARNIEARTSDKELGAVMDDTRRMLKDAGQTAANVDMTVVRLRRELMRAVDDVAQGAQSFAALARTLKQNPSAIISGRQSRRLNEPE